MQAKMNGDVWRCVARVKLSGLYPTDFSDFGARISTNPPQVRR